MLCARMQVLFSSFLSFERRGKHELSSNPTSFPELFILVKSPGNEVAETPLPPSPPLPTPPHSSNNTRTTSRCGSLPDKRRKPFFLRVKIIVYNVYVCACSNKGLNACVPGIGPCTNIESHFTYSRFSLLLPQEITISSFRVCVKDLAGMDSQHDPVTVDYAVIGGN